MADKLIYGMGINDYINVKEQSKYPDTLKVNIVDATLDGKSASIIISKDGARRLIKRLQELQ